MDQCRLMYCLPSCLPILLIKTILVKKFSALLTEVLTHTLTTIEQIDNILIEYICDTSDALKYYLENEQNIKF